VPRRPGARPVVHVGERGSLVSEIHHGGAQLTQPPIDPAAPTREVGLEQGRNAAAQQQEDGLQPPAVVHDGGIGVTGCASGEQAHHEVRRQQGASHGTATMSSEAHCRRAAATPASGPW